LRLLATNSGTRTFRESPMPQSQVTTSAGPYLSIRDSTETRMPSEERQ
jgi:hypothetical protein